MKKINTLLALDPADLKIFNDILQTIPYTLYAFGSRTKNTHKKFSDIDLCILEEISDLDLFYLKEKFEESNLPMKVEIARWHDLSSDFQQLIQHDLIRLGSFNTSS